MFINNKILVGKSETEESFLLLNMANRHGIIAGASGSGKTITIKVLAESFSDAGIPVFLADIKGDLASLAQEGEMTENISKRVENLHLSDFSVAKYPVCFWDIYGNYGHFIRTKISSIGPNILSMMLGLSEVQEGTLNILFKIASDENLDLIDLKDLRALLTYINDNRSNYISKYGNITPQSIGVIQRCLLTLENQGANYFFGEPELDINDFLSHEGDKGIINILHAVELFKSPDLYASFMLWLLTELFNNLPEVGDLDKPKIVFFFDEAHLLFNGMPGYRLKQITQIIKLIRSRGIGIYFASQSPNDIPSEIISQLGNKIQHTLRAYTPSEQKGIKAVADSFRSNENFDTMEAIMQLGTGEAVVSFLNEDGEPNKANKVTILPPRSKIGTIDDITRNKIINISKLIGKYDEALDKTSAYEIVMQKNADKKAEEEKALKMKEEEKLAKEKAKEEEKLKKEKEKQMKNDPMVKLGKKVTNKAVDKLINKSLNKVFKGLFK